VIEDVLKEAEAKMQKAVEAARRELVGIRTGRASPALVERLPVEYYGQPTPLMQLSTITAPEPRLLVIQPFDPNAIPMIEKAIMKSELGLNPSNDGRVIRIVLPQLTEERRRELVRLVHRKVEEFRVAIRNVRREALEDLRELEKEKLISQDDHRRAQERLQKLTDKYIGLIDNLEKEKEKEILEE
jgi:ribosome recycling factor